MLLAQKALEICLGTQPAIDLVWRGVRRQQEKTRRSRFVTLELLYRLISFVLSCKSVRYHNKQSIGNIFCGVPGQGTRFSRGSCTGNVFFPLRKWIPQCTESHPMDPFGTMGHDASVLGLLLGQCSGFHVRLLPCFQLFLQATQFQVQPQMNYINRRKADLDLDLSKYI